MFTLNGSYTNIVGYGKHKILLLLLTNLRVKLSRVNKISLLDFLAIIQ